MVAGLPQCICGKSAQMSRYTRARTSSGHRASLGWKRTGGGEEGRLTDSRMEEGRRMQQRSVHRLYTRLHT